MIQILHWKKRPFAYALVLTVGFAFLLSILENLPSNYYFTGAAILYFVLLFELYSTIFYAKRLLDQFEFPPVETPDKISQYIHHLLLPSFTYFAFVMFLYFNSQATLTVFTLAFVFIIFSVLFTNIRAFYEDKFRLEIITHNIYDLLTLIIMFVASDSIINIFISFGSPLLYTVLSTILILSVLGSIVLIRYHMLKPINVVLLITLAVLYGLLFSAFLTIEFNVLIISFLTTLFFYYVIAYFNHKVDGTLSLKILAEYVVVFLILIVLLYGIA